MSERPELYLYGLSLGSMGVESVLSSVNIVNEPVDGAFMVGPPFVNEMHSRLERDRDPGSPASLPVYESGRTVRFSDEQRGLEPVTGAWGPTRVAYLQHASDPVVFFSSDLAFDRPAWLADGQRGPDVSPTMGWVPLVTMWQVLLDMPGAGNVPSGYGHMYSARANLDGLGRGHRAAQLVRRPGRADRRRARQPVTPGTHRPVGARDSAPRTRHPVVMVGAAVGPLDVRFEAELEQSPAEGGWTYLVWPGSAEFFGTRGLVKVTAHHRRRAGAHVVHGARRRSPQAAGQGRGAPQHRQAGRRPGDGRAHRAPGLSRLHRGSPGCRRARRAGRPGVPLEGELGA